MATPSVSQRDWTVAKLHALPDDGNRYEIIDGALYVTPAPRFMHQRALFDLASMLHAYVKDIPFAIMCLTADIQYSDRTLVQPDLFVYPRVPGRTIREWADVHPLQRTLAPRVEPSGTCHHEADVAARCWPRAARDRRRRVLPLVARRLTMHL